MKITWEEAVQTIKSLGSPGVTLRFPEGKDRQEGLRELKEELRAAQEVIEKELETIEV